MTDRKKLLSKLRRLLRQYDKSTNRYEKQALDARLRMTWADLHYLDSLKQ